VVAGRPDDRLLAVHQVQSGRRRLPSRAALGRSELGRAAQAAQQRREHGSLGPEIAALAFPGELDGAGRSRLTVESLDGASRAAFGSRVEIYSLSWSADGRRVLYSTNSPWFAARGPGEIHAVSAATGAGAVLARGVDPAWSRDGKFLSFVSRKGARTTLFLQRHGTRRVVLSRPNFGFVHAWSPTGHLLAFAATNRYGQGRVFVFDPGRAKPLRAVTRWAYGPVASIVWSRDGRRILFARTTG
jgi:Tol biopolymer transport system component